jgi:hypothetical protein
MSANYGKRTRRRFTPGPTTLLALYPAAWRGRYGDELDALILDMQADGRDTGARIGSDLLRSALRERLRGAGDPSGRVRGGASLVLWAWALFAIAGMIVVKTTEHWQQALPRHTAAHVAFSVFQLVAIVASLAVAGGIALTLPAAWRLLQERGWARIRTRALVAAALTVVVVAGLVAIGVWARSLSVADRNGHDHLYGAAFLAWATLAVACLLAWTSVATRIAADARIDRAVLRAHTWLAPAVAVAMTAMTVATLVWWVVVGTAAPGALTGGSTHTHPSPVVPALVLACVLMLLASGGAGIGAVRAESARAEL